MILIPCTSSIFVFYFSHECLTLVFLICADDNMPFLSLVWGWNYYMWKVFFTYKVPCKANGIILVVIKSVGLFKVLKLLVLEMGSLNIMKKIITSLISVIISQWTKHILNLGCMTAEGIFDFLVYCYHCHVSLVSESGIPYSEHSCKQ